MQRNGGGGEGQKAHIKDNVRRTAAVMGRVWSIGKKRFERDWGKSFGCLKG